jgi:hypothetical protein
LTVPPFFAFPRQCQTPARSCIHLFTPPIRRTVPRARGQCQVICVARPDRRRTEVSAVTGNCLNEGAFRVTV